MLLSQTSSAASRMLLARGASARLQLGFAASQLGPRRAHLGAVARSASVDVAVEAVVMASADPTAVPSAAKYDDLLWTDDEAAAGGASAPPPPPPGPSADAAASGASVNAQSKSKSTPPRVADLDARRFRLDPSVERWQYMASGTYTSPASGSKVSDGAAQAGLLDSLTGMVRRAASVAVVEDGRSAAFWAYHSARITFFIGQAVAGLVAHHLYETVQGAQSPVASSGKTPLSAMASSSEALGSELAARVNEALETFKQDYSNIASGAYGLPWDMTTAGHRQYNPLWALGRTAMFVQDAVATLRRRVRDSPDDVWLRGSMYPQYYQNTFHYQSDGWFSDRSAQVYEHSTEVLFFGRQDAMQRTSLLPVADWVKASGRDPSQLRLLEVAAGTGRFHTFIKDAYPTMPTVCSDLSPFYLARARENVRYWKRMRQADNNLGGVDGAGVEYLQSAAEGIAAPDASFDIVVCVYLFHELPETIRRKAVAEFHRVLRPGGLCVFTDSVQTGDRPAWDNVIGNFQNFNEPYYRNYVACDLGTMFAEAGFRPETKWLCSASKTLSFVKPHASAAEAVPGVEAAAAAQ